MVERHESETERLIEALRGIVGALNAVGIESGNTVLVPLAKVETRLDHLERQLTTMQKTLVGLSVSVITMVIKIVAEMVIQR